MSLSLVQPSESCKPAPYGRACAGCSRAKCKCFYRSEGSGCERCHRLGKACEPSAPIRKRKARSPPAAQLLPPPPPSRLEEKLDDLVSLLRSQAIEKQTQAQSAAPRFAPKGLSTPDSTPAFNSHGDSSFANPAGDPEITLDTDADVVHLMRPVSPGVSVSPILGDVSCHEMPFRAAAEQLETFHRILIPMFPFVHIPTSTNASDLRYEKPFLWLVIMSLTTKSVPQQFAMEETIWSIISQRIVCEHLADLDLLLGMICFAAWSHVFKKDKPFMCMLTQMAVSLALDLALQNEPSVEASRRSKSSQLAAHQKMANNVRTMEERRTILALFHLTSTTWMTYRKTEPLRWTPYLESCLRILRDGDETQWDILLATQVRCQIITNSLTCPSLDESPEGADSRAPSAMLMAALLGQLNDIRQRLPPQIYLEKSTQFYLHSAEITIRASLLGKRKSPDSTSHLHLQRLKDLDSILTCVERWLAVLSNFPLARWIGIDVDFFSQFTHCLVVLYKLTTLVEPGWDLEEVKKRADVIGILDHSIEEMEQLPGYLGLLDAEGPRRGLFFKSVPLFQTIKALFLTDMAPKLPTGAIQIAENNNNYSDAIELGEEFTITDELISSLSNEPWLSDMFASQWDF